MCGTISEKINLQKKFFVINKYILLPHPLFSIIINSGTMKELKMVQTVTNTHFVVEI